MRVIAKMDKFGRILVPQKVRLDLGLKPGADVIFSYSKSSRGMELSTRPQAIKAAQAEFVKYNPNRERWSEEILRDRRRELKAEKSKP
jgi:bifunctional DNA-binding transcriptional regulator/antitoxin component of YhaV-PrlF toxin-antitoxin module